MKKPHPVTIGLLVALVGIILIAFTGCTRPTESQCDQWERAIKTYEVALAAGHIPSEDEARIAATIRALYAVQCAKVATLVPVPDGARAIGTISRPRQPQRITTTDTGSRVIYYLEIPFSIIQDPTGVYRSQYGLATVTIGPLYRTADPVRKQYLWLPDEPYLRGLTKTPTMSPVR